MEDDRRATFAEFADFYAKLGHYPQPEVPDHLKHQWEDMRMWCRWCGRSASAILGDEDTRVRFICDARYEGGSVGRD